ncbi:MAG: methyl-accepting chemotaxis protein [bacterium]
MWKNLGLGKKIAAGFCSILCLLLFLSVCSYVSLNKVAVETHKAQVTCNDRAFAIEKEVDHLKWVQSLSALFLDDQVTQVAVQLDPHKCGLGQWMYSADTKEMAQADPALRKILDGLEKPHATLHESGQAIQEKYQTFDMNLKSILAHRWIDHLSWANALLTSILHHQPFTGSIDHHACAFGQWYYAGHAYDAAFEEHLNQWEQPHEQLHASAAKIIQAQQAGDWEGALAIYDVETTPAMSRLNEAFQATSAWVDQTAARQQEALEIFQNETAAAVAEAQTGLEVLTEHFSEQSNRATTAVNETINSTVNLIWILTALALIIGGLAAYFVTRGITKPIGRIVAVTHAVNEQMLEVEAAIEQVSNSNLVIDIRHTESFQIGLDATDEMGRLAHAIDNMQSVKDRIVVSVRRMALSLSKMIHDINGGSAEVATAAAEVSSASEQMSRGAVTQTEQVIQVSTAIEQMAATVVETSKNATDASGAARTASDTAESGGKIVSDTIQGMQRIAHQVRASSDAIAKLSQSAQQIGEITTVIDDIADQTNLLALNAAIEAARAGEQGRGFAVVADEVRKLAERTGKATGEITDMIKGIQSETGAAVDDMESGLAEVDQGRELADKAGSALQEIMAVAQSVDNMIGQIATATEEQSAAAEEIARNVERVSAVSKETAAGAEQSAIAAEQLNQQAEKLRQVVGGFKIANNVTIFDLGEQDHALYVKKMDGIILSPETADRWAEVDHHHCRLGKWYYSDQTEGLRGDAAFRQLEDPHLKVHYMANRAVKAARDGDIRGARDFAKASHEASVKVIEGLRQLKMNHSRQVAKS